MSPLPDHRPQQMSLGPLETEILNIVWTLDCVTVKQVHEYILTDPDRELAYTSVTTVLRRLTQKGWLVCDESERAFVWRPLISRREAQMLRAHQQLNKFLEVGNPDLVASFADSLDSASIEQIEAIAEKLKAIRKVREDKE
ncbi:MULTISPECIES: BlaI/MecI/CopY family transcriptional regulator [Okeania]|uniref:CopY family transcriptional regulator n=1 Tax=Okeania hirsuta TaxID=1458930 RepID=A0A3N6RIX9_9CYAN|nr:MULTISPECIES: BlaI/MecI/CopY family transcriptional regulator [Okeania]NET17218.1 CopY family transcriptional regulator [Okeania sp. SIO1H6]NES76062.1 CopY family transcriptional regulator [Okeania sp. SIO1H4]NES92336.1 CopY family transcriptional regulator [Okeania sp. SIO2B9]NET21505.1 CopY family transcriptional regulator [Okeania sp. SIO1H5]NET76464.1 CopY family transcriptional regulator [Okeania sp. SIO1F9]